MTEGQMFAVHEYEDAGMHAAAHHVIPRAQIYYDGSYGVRAWRAVPPMPVGPPRRFLAWASAARYLRSLGW